MQISSPVTLSIAFALATIIVIITIQRRLDLPPLARVTGAAALLLFSLAAGSPMWQWPARAPVVVMVDLSPSTRTAGYRTKVALHDRIHRLLGDVPFRIEYFAEGKTDREPAGADLPDMPAERTVFNPPPAAAILLFSDAQFSLPDTAPPIYVVADPGLDHPADAAVTRLEVRRGEAVAAASNGGPPRLLALRGAEPDSPVPVEHGSRLVVRAVRAGAALVSAQLSRADAWPENDSLDAPIPPPDVGERWWAGQHPPATGWKVLSPGELPTDPAAFLSPAVIVLDDVSAADLTELQQQRLEQYVRDLGGGLVILGGPHAFAAGGYAGTTLDRLSPLASHPPQPTAQWLLLADGSGSMAEPAEGGTRWQAATGSLLALLPHLPPRDLVSVGSFSEKLDWWAEGITAKQAQSLALPPPGTGPHGPTNLEQALNDLATRAEPGIEKPLLLLSDAQTQITDAPGLASLLKARKIHLHVLVIGKPADATALPALRAIITATGGSLITQPDPQRWADAARDLLRAATPRLLENVPVEVRFRGDLESLAPRSVGLWNHTWLKEGATPLAEADSAGERIAFVAKWPAGNGQAVAAAFEGLQDAEALARLASRTAADPRFHLSWETGATLNVQIDAADGTSPLNGVPLRFEQVSAEPGSPGAQVQDIPQIGPGRYALEMAAPRSGIFASVRLSGRVLGQVAVGGRYAPEYERIGNNEANMQELARRTGGQLISPRQITPIDFHFPTHSAPLAPLLNIAAAILLATGLVRWRLQ